MDGIPCITETQLLSLTNSNDIESTSSKDVCRCIYVQIIYKLYGHVWLGGGGRECGGSKGGAGYV